MTKTMTKSIVTIVLMVPVFAFFALLGTAVSIGAANAWLLDGPFSQGWTAVWDNPWIALGWFALFGFKGVTTRS